MGEDERTRQQERREPGIDWDRVRFRDDDAGPHPYIVPQWRSRSAWRTVLAVAVVLAVLLVWFRQPLASLIWPDTRIQQLLDQGESALQSGRLSAFDGSGARQYFEAAQALDTDRAEAREGLIRVGQAALEQAQQSIEAGKFANAHAYLDLATELQVPRAQLQPIAEELRSREVPQAGIEPLLVEAAQAQAAQRLDGTPDAALPIYQRILALQPNRIEALEGREDALTDLLQQAHQRLQKGDLAGGGELIHRARDYDGGHVDLPAAQAALARAIDARLQQAQRNAARGRLDAAEQDYRAVIAAAPEETRARQGLERVALAHATRARKEAADFRFDSAATSLAKAREIAPQSAAIRDAGQAIERSRVARTQVGGRLSPVQRDMRLRQLLDDMALAESRGNWITPPGESAYDKLRAAQSLAPEDERVRRAAARVLPAVQRCFEVELRANRLRRADECLDMWRVMDSRQAATSAAATQLAQRWIAVGNERLGAGDIAFAVQAREEAHELDARAPGLDDFSERVRVAQSPDSQR